MQVLFRKALGQVYEGFKKKGKRLAGKCKLRDALINKMQNYFGVVLRYNLGSISLMKKAIWTSI